MHFEGTFDVKVQREKVFDFLMDAKNLSACIPGLQKLEVNSPNDFTVVVQAGVSFIKGDFTIRLELVDRERPSYARLVAGGSGMASTIDLDATMELSEIDGGTSLKWRAEAKIGGRIALVGQRLISGAAEKIVTQLFDNLRSNLVKA